MIEVDPNFSEVPHLLEELHTKELSHPTADSGKITIASG